ncbi:hypothetical protein K4K52_004602 [Colletotrichum sp. SAR 10_76]|nr:hypothetical protein K4K52_004602 [Colletotrichum sp. SAR 10_76]
MTDAQEPRQDGPPQLGDDKPAKLELKIRHIDDRQLGFRVMYQPEDNNINVDIIAVHGIAADPDWTWTWTDSTRTSEVNWLSDMEMLPQALPHARILRFGYNSIWYGPEAVKQRLRSIAIGMLDELCDEREAYNLAQTLTSDYPGISASTSGIVFMGTPHRGTGSALHSQGKIYQAVVRAQCETQGNILEVLEENNETLVDVVDEFTRLVHVATPKVEIVCFFEQMSTSVGKIVQDDDIKEFVVGEQSGVLRGHRSLGLPRDHFSLNKFSGKEDGNYKSVRRQLAKMTRIATESRSNSVPEDRKHLKDILSKMLQLVDHKKKLKDVSLRRPKGEQETWLTESQDFTNWMATPNSFAWLIGRDTAVAYFFFQFDDTTTFDRDVFVKSLLAQLYDAMYLTSAARELENNMNQLDSDTNTELALRSSRDEKDIGTLMEETHLSNNAATAGVINMEKHRSKVDKVIGNLIDAKMKETRMKDSYLGEGSMSVNQFRQTLIEKADGVIFYASIQLDAILNAPPLRKEDLDRRLKTLPKDLYDTYEQALLRMPVSDTDFVYRIMVWQLFTAVPMTIDEVGEAVRIPLGTEEQFSGESEHSSQIKMEGRFPNPRALVKLIPGLLLTRLVNWADSDFRVTAAGSEPGEIVSVGHYSFMEYLTSGMAMKSNHEAVRKFAIDTEEMRIRMAVNCLRYFVHAASLLAQKVKLQQEIPTAIEIEKAFPLLELAIVNGLRLTEEMKYEKWTDSLKILLKTVLRTGPLFDFFRLLLNNTYEWDDNNFVPLTYLISEDMDCILSFILENNPPAIEEINTGLRIASSINKAGAVGKAF